MPYERACLITGGFSFDHSILMAPHQAGHVANAHARIVAKYIAERVKGRQPKYALPGNLRREEVVTEDFAWAGRMYEDMFG